MHPNSYRPVLRKSRRPRPSPGKIQSFMGLSERTLLTPKLAQPVYLLGLLFTLVLGALYLLGGILDRSAFEIGLGVLVLFVGPFYWRLVCESWMMRYWTYEVLVEIRRILKGSRKESPKTESP